MKRCFKRLFYPDSLNKALLTFLNPEKRNKHYEYPNISDVFRSMMSFFFSSLIFTFEWIFCSSWRLVIFASFQTIFYSPWYLWSKSQWRHSELETKQAFVPTSLDYPQVWANYQMSEKNRQSRKQKKKKEHCRREREMEMKEQLKKAFNKFYREQFRRERRRRVSIIPNL